MINRQTFEKTHEFKSFVNFGEIGDSLGSFHVSPVHGKPNTYRVWGFSENKFGKLVKVSEQVAEEFGISVWIRGFSFGDSNLSLAA
jgi:hypothetical protein